MKKKRIFKILGIIITVLLVCGLIYAIVVASILKDLINKNFIF
jgi:K+-transporting ATPase c subunit